MRHALFAQARRFASSSSTSSSTTETAQKTYSAFQERASGLLGHAQRIGGSASSRAGSMLGSYRQPLSYNWSVAREFAKQVYVAERLAPPTSWSTVTSAYRTLWQNASNPAFWRQVMQSGEWARLGIYGIEAYGIYKLGEMIGRRHVVGYKLN